jgi:hypothetical protein
MAERVIALLNEMIEADPAAVGLLVRRRVPCNEALATHPTIQAGGEVGSGEVGLLGVLNGLCGRHDAGDREGWGAVAIEFDGESDNGRPLRARFLESEA